MAADDPKPDPETKMPSATSPSTQDENSGLHDIKAMAQSTRARNSRRITAQHVEEDVLASSAAGLRAVALPDPSLSSASVSMPAISMPSPEMSPSGVPSRPSGRMAASTNAPFLPGAAPASAVSELATLASTKAAAPTKSKLPLILGGVLLLAAAGGVTFALTRSSSPAAAPQAAALTAPASNPTTAPIATAAPLAAPEAPTAAPIVAPIVAPNAAETPVAAATPESADKLDKHGDADAKAVKVAAAIGAETKVEVKVAPAEVKPVPVEAKAEAKPEAKPDEDSIDAMLARAGGIAKTDADDDKPEKKALTADDIKTARASRMSAAQACYGKHGVAGNVAVKLSVDPSGKVKKATASGALAGTPSGDCVVEAAKGATFPAWDGPTQSVTFSFSLTD